jgi:cell division protein ZapA
MSSKENIEVVIGGKVYKLAGENGADHIRAVAGYVDAKLREVNSQAGDAVLNSPSFPVLLALNIADELYKDKGGKTALANKSLNDSLVASTKEVAALREQYDKQSKELEAVRSEMTAVKSALDSVDDEYKRKEEAFNKQLSAMQTRIDEKSQYISTLIAKIDNKNQELNGLSNKLAEKNTALNELNKKSAERNIKLNTVNKERDELAVKLKAVKEALRIAQTQLESSTTEYNNKLAELESTHKEELSTLEATHKDKLAELENAHKDKLAELESENTENVAKLKAELKDAEYRCSALSEDYNTMRSEFETFQHADTDGQLQSAFAKMKIENIELRREVERLRK